MNSLWDIRIFLGLVPKESLCIFIFRRVHKIAKSEYFASSCLSVRLSAWNSAPTARNFMKSEYFSKTVE
jgi:hypothetical protein